MVGDVSSIRAVRRTRPHAASLPGADAGRSGSDLVVEGVTYASRTGRSTASR